MRQQYCFSYQNFTFYYVIEKDGSLSYLDIKPDANLAVNKTAHPFSTQLNDYFNGTLTDFSINLTINGTEFSKNVWNELLKIPYGKTTCYSKIAEALNTPNSSRAVGRSVGSNKIMIVIPCHRVIGKNGSLTGFSGGLALKKLLLKTEKINF